MVWIVTLLSIQWDTSVSGLNSSFWHTHAPSTKVSTNGMLFIREVFLRQSQYYVLFSLHGNRTRVKKNKWIHQRLFGSVTAERRIMQTIPVLYWKLTLCFHCLVNHVGWQRKNLRFCCGRWGWLAHTQMKHLLNCISEMWSPDNSCPKLDKWRSWSFLGSVGNTQLSCVWAWAAKSPPLVH